MSTGQLWLTRRFGPMFWVQFLGAFNDNLLKNVVVLLVTFGSLTVDGLSQKAVTSLSAGLFILPFFLFSGQAGQVSDRFSKTQVVRVVKAFEVLFMALASLAFYLQSLPLLWVVLFLMGTHSAYFGPAKYSILRELVDEKDLNAANALIEVGSFLAILLGTIGAGVLVSQEVPAFVTGLFGLALAGGGLFLAFLLPSLEPASPSLKVSKNPFPPVVETLRVSKEENSVYLAIMGISWFWFLGATLLTELPSLAKNVLGLSEGGVTYFLALFCVGIALGALLSEKLGGHKMELGLVPLGSFFLTVGLFDWGFVLRSQVSNEHIDLARFVTTSLGMRLSADLLMVAIAGGLYTVPLYTLLQERTPKEKRGRVIAGNNILNSLFMVASAVMLMVFSARDMPSWATLVVLSVMNWAVAVYIYTLLPEFLFRLVAWCIAHIMYRLKVKGARHIPETGAAILAPNHVSFVDWLLLATVTQRTIRFVMYYKFHQVPLVGFIFRDAKVIPIASKTEDAGILEEAMVKMEAALRDGELVCIFPEGALTDSGELLPFKPGILKLLSRVSVPVIPVGISGMWGSFFSRKDKAAFRKPFRRVWSRVTLEVGVPLKPDGLTLERLTASVSELTGPPSRAHPQSQ